MVSECCLIRIVPSPPGTPGCPHIQERADRGHGGGAPASIFSDPEDALSEAELQSPQGICPCPWYFMTKTGLALCPNTH